MRTTLLLACTLALLLVGCGQTRRYGDAGGQPVAFTVHLDRAFVKGMHNRQWQPSVGAGVAVGSGGYSSTGVGVGFSFSSTHVYILGGDGPAEAQVFMKEIGWGETAFTVPLTPGRKLHLTAKAEGGREGWESLGEITVPHAADARVAVTLDANGVKLVVTPAEAAAPAAQMAPGPAIERAPAPPAASSQKPAAGSAKPEAGSWKPEATADSTTPDTGLRTPDALPPPGEHPDAGDKPPTDKNPPVHLDPGPPPGTAPQAAPAAEPARGYPDPSLDRP